MVGREQIGWPRWQALGDRLQERARSPRFAIAALAVAIFAYAVLVLWLTRGGSFTLEEITYVGESKGFGAREILAPYPGGHLIAITRLFFEANLRIFGPEHLPFQLIVIVLTATTSALPCRNRVYPAGAPVMHSWPVAQASAL